MDKLWKIQDLIELAKLNGDKNVPFAEDLEQYPESVIQKVLTTYSL